MKGEILLIDVQETKKLIHWLLSDSGISIQLVAEKVNIPVLVLNNIKMGVLPLDELSVREVISLKELALRMENYMQNSDVVINRDGLRKGINKLIVDELGLEKELSNEELDDALKCLITKH